MIIFKNIFSKSYGKLYLLIIFNITLGTQNNTMELYIKAGPKDGDVGDCPFAHYVRCVLNYKKLEYKSLPCKPDSKPDWLIKELEGKMPCLKQGNLKMVLFTF